MKEFLTARDVEDLVVRGITQIPLDENIVLTDLARERAAALGVVLTKNVTGAEIPPLPTPLASASSILSSVKALSPITSLDPKPKGCLHGHLEPGNGASAASPSAGLTTGSSAESIVDRLVEAVRRSRQ